MEETLPPNSFNPRAKAQFPPKVQALHLPRTGALQALARGPQPKGLQDHRVTLNLASLIHKGGALLVWTVPKCPMVMPAPISYAPNMVHGGLP